MTALMATLTPLLLLSFFTSSLSAPAVVHAAACVLFRACSYLGSLPAATITCDQRKTHHPVQKLLCSEKHRPPQAGGMFLFYFLYSKWEVGVSDPTLSLYMFKMYMYTEQQKNMSLASEGDNMFPGYKNPPPSPLSGMCWYHNHLRGTSGKEVPSPPQAQLKPRCWLCPSAKL